MRVAALYDVHGNLPALDAVLADVEAAGIDVLVSGGDVAWGPYPAECLQRLTEVDARFLTGNADRGAVSGQEERDRWCRERLGAEQIEAIERWPGTVELHVDGLGEILFCHGSPRSDEEILTELTPDGEVAEAIAGTAADVVVSGHTHHQYDREIGDVRLVNPGSVGLPYEGRRGAFWCALGPSVELRCTDYDVESALAAITATGFPDAAELYDASLRAPLSRPEVVARFESRRGA